MTKRSIFILIAAGALAGTANYWRAESHFPGSIYQWFGIFIVGYIMLGLVLMGTGGIAAVVCKLDMDDDEKIENITQIASCAIAVFCFGYLCLEVTA